MNNRENTLQRVYIDAAEIWTANSTPTRAENPGTNYGLSCKSPPVTES
jgi:hypothetical protein